MVASYPTVVGGLGQRYFVSKRSYLIDGILSIILFSTIRLIQNVHLKLKLKRLEEGIENSLNNYDSIRFI